LIYINIVFLSVIGALIGWITNKIAIRLIFRPINPVVIPVLKITIQGILPSRKEEIAKSIGDIVETELVSLNDIINMYKTPENIEDIKTKLRTNISIVLDDKLSTTIAAPFKKYIINFVDGLVEKESEKFIENIIRDFSNEIPKRISLSKSIEDKINGFDMRHLEKMIISIAGRELKHIEELGALLGFIIGILQGLIITLVSRGRGW
jgi:uncharacterized membrane protein YheB (UPF0754 family)